MPFTKVQTTSGNLSGTSATLTWSSAPTPGNWLGLTMTFFGNSPSTITPPSGWTQIGSEVSHSTGKGCFADFFQKINCNNANNENFSWLIGTTNGGTFTAIEYSGLDTTNPLAESHTQVGNSSLPNTDNVTGITGLVVALFAQVGGATVTFSAPTGSYVIEVQNSVGSLASFAGSGILDNNPFSTSSTSVTSTDTDDWCTCILRLTAPTPPPGFYVENQYPAIASEKSKVIAI